ncbi:MAG: aminotransferase class V-fold PLP-dependent enzyme, partial [Anaerolineales bacterium]
MSIIYFDNAATSWPKPPAVRRALETYFGEAGGNPGRSGHRMSIAAARIVQEARQSLTELFHLEDPARIAFTKNATEALNLAIYGLLRPGDHAITTSIEHNSVMRPLRHLESLGLELTVIPCQPDGTLELDQVARAIRPNTRLLATLHGSNVTGTLLPIVELAGIARASGVPYLVDASQTAGAIPIDVEGLGVDLFAFTGHKSLLGLTGSGGLYTREGLELRPLMRGGTGSDSDRETQPQFMPDVYESGTLNVVGLAGLAAGVRFITEKGISNIAAHERALVAQFIAGAQDIPGLVLYGPTDTERRCAVVSFNLEGLLPSEVGQLLDQEFGILSRVGLHCAPGAHRTLGTFPRGTVRF